MIDLRPEGHLLIVPQAVDSVPLEVVACDSSAQPEDTQVLVVGEPVLGTELLRQARDLISAEAAERVLHPGRGIVALAKGLILSLRSGGLVDGGVAALVLDLGLGKGAGRLPPLVILLRLSNVGHVGNKSNSQFGGSQVGGGGNPTDKQTQDCPEMTKTGAWWTRNGSKSWVQKQAQSHWARKNICMQS